MEFGLDELRTDVRPASGSFELSRHVEIARTCSNLVAESKFCLSVRPSVCLSHACFVTNPKNYR